MSEVEQLNRKIKRITNRINRTINKIKREKLINRKNNMIKKFNRIIRNNKLTKNNNFINKRYTTNNSIISSEQYVYNNYNFIINNAHYSINKLLNDNFIFNIYNKKEYKFNEIIKENINNYGTNGKFITFILILKNRKKRGLVHLKYISEIKSFFEYADFIIVEDKSDDNLNINTIDSRIKYYRVKSGVKWSRSRLLNFGIKKTETELFLANDVDFIYDNLFIYRLIKICNYIDLKKNVLVLPVHQTHKTNCNKKFERYGGCWIYNTQIIKSIGGFNYKIVGWGKEDRELEYRLFRNNIKTIYMENILSFPYVLHLSHNKSLRGNRTKKYHSVNNFQQKKIRFLHRVKLLMSNVYDDNKRYNIINNE